MMVIRRVLPIALALLVGLLGGRLLSGGGQSSSPTPHPDSPGPTSYLSGGVGIGYAHTREGAIAASAGHQQAFADPAVLRPGELRRRIEALATRKFAPTMLRVNRPGVRRLTRGAVGAGLGEEVPTLYIGVPVSYKVLSYSPQRAVIRSWGFTVLGNATIAEPSAYFGTSRMELAWVRGDWKIAHTQAAFGPTPKLATPRVGGEGFDLADLVTGMRPYAVGP